MKCFQCESEIQPGDRFCGNCGAAVVEDKTGRSHERVVDQCTVCGYVNPPHLRSCESCGAILPARATGSSNDASAPRETALPKAQRRISAGGILAMLQSWKVTLGLAVVFVVVLVVIGTSQREEVHDHDGTGGDVPPHAAEMMEEIKQLQQRVDDNPNDAEAMLLLANRLHDVRFFPSAITMYQRYLEKKPEDTDARVDLGICYFEMALIDGKVKAEYFTKAEEEMKKALTYDPKHQLAHFNLGIVFLQSGNIQESNAWFKKCIDINPDSETGRRARELYNQHQSLNIQ